jgi:hypothetical protein
MTVLHANVLADSLMRVHGGDHRVTPSKKVFPRTKLGRQSRLQIIEAVCRNSLLLVAKLLTPKPIWGQY